MALKGNSTAELDQSTKVVDQSKPAEVLTGELMDELPEHHAPAQTELAQVREQAGQLTKRSSNLAALADDGFDDLDNDVGFGSFPIVKLENGSFEAEGMKACDQFHCQIMMAKPKYLYRAGPKEEDPIFYSYDKLHDTKGATVQSRIDTWASEGFDRSKVECKEYREVVVKMIDTELKDSLCLLSVPPASKTRLGGYRVELQMTKKKKLNEVVTLVHKGTKITVGSKAFYPWAFKYVGPADEAAA